MMHVAIIGAGELGTALGKVLEDRCEVSLWDVDAAKVPNMRSLRDAVAGADVVFCAVPSFAMRAAVVGVLPFIDVSRTVMVSMAKGIEAATKKFMDEVLEELIPSGRFGVMGGPMLAAELGAGLECAAVVASRDRAAAAIVQSAFEGTKVRIELSDDLRGVAAAGVLKNIYAVLMGVAAGFDIGEDETAVFATRAMEEMVSIGKKLGAREETICGTAGYADFLATAYSNHSRNRNAGIALAIGGLSGRASVKRDGSAPGEVSEDRPVMKGEGILALPSLVALLGAEAASFPLLSGLVKIATQHGDSRDSLNKILEEAP